jgi:Flp pilus assembly protein TadD
MMSGNASADEAQEAWGKGNAACLRGDLDLAVRYYTDSIRLNPKVAATHNNRGYAYLQKGDSDKAITDYDEAIRLDPKYAKSYFFRGSSYENKGDQDKAVANYTAAIRLDPRYARPTATGARRPRNRQTPMRAPCDAGKKSRAFRQARAFS